MATPPSDGSIELSVELSEDLTKPHTPKPYVPPVPAPPKIAYALEKWWYSKKCWPTSHQIGQLIGVSAEEAERQFIEFNDYLWNRGINRMLCAGEAVPHSLDTFRHDVALAVSNIHDPKRLAAKLKQLKIPETMYRGWLQDPLFAKFLERRSEELIREELPEISRNLTKQASNGDIRAAKLLLEYTGKIQAQGSSNTQVNVFNDRDSATYIVRRLVEVIKVHVKDPEILQAIARDFDSIMNVEKGMSSLEERDLGLSSSTPAIEGPTGLEYGLDPLKMVPVKSETTRLDSIILDF